MVVHGACACGAWHLDLVDHHTAVVATPVVMAELPEAIAHVMRAAVAPVGLASAVGSAEPIGS